MNTFLPYMLFKSITIAARNATIQPGVMQAWIDEIEAQVDSQGKFTKSAVGYRTFSPPPVFWDYKCAKCRAWIQLEAMGYTVYPGQCKWVEGEIARNGWCSIWLPPDDKPVLSWIKEFQSGDW